MAGGGGERGKSIQASEQSTHDTSEPFWMTQVRKK